MRKWETPELNLLGVDQTKAGFDVEGGLFKSTKNKICSASDSSNNGRIRDASSSSDCWS
ncbi:hypothetical protein [Turicibacter sanguinis]|uniref:hypothetical protein n=1 Tax=Turicibacter sanguinis TaxID=154288 RepID=UPI0018AB5227|nr:hypothetical protein [Turicibacter sanguinis]MDB8558247.1 hypothetical protein [Turicibacter sanguinis]MDB8561023.1 hypothetical protein [Turicibacter sanguinis]